MAVSPGAPAGVRPRPPRKPAPMRTRSGIMTMEDQIRFAYGTPSPVVYDPKKGSDITDPKPLGKIFDSNEPSVMDHVPRSKSWVPGPGAYSNSTNDFCLPEGGRVNRKPPQDKVILLDEYPKPAPGEYGVPSDPSRPRQLYGKFGRDPKVPKFIRDEELRTRGIPGPGAHDVMESMSAVKPFCTEGGKTLHFGKPESYFEAAPKRWEDNPDPGAYELPGAMRSNKGVGRLVYKYQSSTLAETKAMVNKVNTHDAPGPGTYDLPEPPPTHPAAVIKGRALGHAMPHPFAYNCQPDRAQKYSLTPVRQQNSADKIFGTGVRRGVAPRFTGAAGRRGSRPSSSDSSSKPKDRVHVTDLSSTGVEALDINPEDQVQWRAGGFAPLAKSRSTGSLAPKTNPSMEETKKSYPQLSGKKRERSTFLPMTVRKSEDISTRDNSDEFTVLRRGHVQLAALAEGIHQMTSAALEPLDLERLKQSASECLKDKANYRMETEGVAKTHQPLVIAEMKGVLAEKIGLKDETFADHGPEAVASLSAEEPPPAI
eukprot:TRINITY_DN68428_c0_g1_i1.p1 TRINITY_DN68428_c0_g1~~TRINITY_DN68428_c0_g1_i1.p1  ORF type:complete len:539 (-),score=70.29 TRINITY_DN68428_c0_g1_i1:239-1855(-)